MVHLYKQIQGIVDVWKTVPIEDIDSIVNLRRDVSVYFYQLSEYKSEQEKAFLTWETKRKSLYYSNYHDNIELGNTAAKSQVYSENSDEVINARVNEVKHEREFKQARDILNSLSEILNAMSSAIKVAENERKQGGYHT